jgi:hypothetical protein
MKNNKRQELKNHDLSLIAKQVLAFYIYHFQVRSLEPTSTGVI